MVKKRRRRRKSKMASMAAEAWRERIFSVKAKIRRRRRASACGMAVAAALEEGEMSAYQAWRRSQWQSIHRRWRSGVKNVDRKSVYRRGGACSRKRTATSRFAAHWQPCAGTSPFTPRRSARCASLALRINFHCAQRVYATPRRGALPRSPHKLDSHLRVRSALARRAACENSGALMKIARGSEKYLASGTADGSIIEGHRSAGVNIVSAETVS